MLAGETNRCVYFPECSEAGQPAPYERVRDPGPAGEGPHHQGQQHGAKEGLQTPPALPRSDPSGQPQSAGCGAGAGHGETPPFFYMYKTGGARIT